MDAQQWTQYTDRTAEIKVGAPIWESLPRDLPVSDPLIASQDTAINPAQRTTKMAKRATNITS